MREIWDYKVKLTDALRAPVIHSTKEFVEEGKKMLKEKATIFNIKRFKFFVKDLWITINITFR